MMECPNTSIHTADNPKPPMPNAASTKLMCATDAYAITRLPSAWASALQVPSVAEKMP